MSFPPLARVVLALCLAAFVSSPAVLAQTAPPPSPLPPTPGFTSKPILQGAITGVPNKEVVLISVTLEPGASSPAHAHPGDCHGNVLEGAIELRVQGLASRRLQAGDSYSTLDGVPHQFTNVGDKPVRLLNMLVVDKGKPRVVPAPAPQ